MVVFLPTISYGADTNTVSNTVSSSNTVTGTTTIDKTHCDKKLKNQHSKFKR